MNIDKDKIKRIVKHVVDDIVSVYPYLLLFYIFSLVLSLFSRTWKSFFYWPAFHIVIIIFSISVLLNLDRKKLNIRNFFSKLLFLNNLLRHILFLTIKKTKELNGSLAKIDRLKIIVILIIAMISIYLKIDIINFLILIYGLISIFFAVWGKITTWFVAIFLISCPFLLILKKEAVAEQMAIYAYHFLVIAVVDQIVEYFREEKGKKVSYPHPRD